MTMIAYSSDGSWFDLADLKIMELPACIDQTNPDEIEETLFGENGPEGTTSEDLEEIHMVMTTRYKVKT